MWPFRKSHDSSLRDIGAALARHEAAIATLRDDFVDLLDKHTRLRGRVYAAGIHKVGVNDGNDQGVEKSRDSIGASRSETKAEVFKRLGIVPGRPVDLSKSDRGE